MRKLTVVVNKKYSSYDVDIGRPGKWGNQFVIGIHGNRADVIRKHREWLREHPEVIVEIHKELKGKRLGCYCAPLPCHGDILAEIANGGYPFSNRDEYS